MSRRTFPSLRTAASLLVAGGLWTANALAQETPPPTPEAPQDQPKQPAAQPGQERSGGIGLGIDVATTGQGVVVANVREDSPAAKIGLRRGDQIVSFAGQSVSTAKEFLNLVRRQQLGSTVKADIRRNGERVDMAIVLGSRENAEDRDVTRQQQPQPQPDGRRASRDQSGRDPQQRQPGAEMERQGERQQTARYQPPPVWGGFVLERAPLGVVVERLHPQGPARRAGLRVGDRIVRVNGRVTAEPEEIYAAIEQRQPGDEIGLTVLRGEELIEGTVRLEAPPLGVVERPIDDFGGGIPDLAGLVEQQRQNTRMLQELMREVRSLRQELEELKSGGRNREASPQ